MPSTDRRLELKAKDIDGSDRLTAGCVCQWVKVWETLFLWASGWHSTKGAKNRRKHRMQKHKLRVLLLLHITEPLLITSSFFFMILKRL